MSNKNEIIKNSIKATKEKRKYQTPTVYQLKITKNKLSKNRKNNLYRVFLEGKWLYNSILASPDIFSYDWKTKVVKCKTPTGLENRNLNIIGSQIKQEIIKKTTNSIKALSIKKKKGYKIGRLKYKSEINSIPLKQFNNTYKIKNHNTIQIQGLGEYKVKGLEQLKDIEDIANANLIKMGDDFYIKITCYKPKEFKPKTKEVIGLDFGIKDSITFSNGIKIDTKIKINKSIKKNHRKLSKKKNKSNNFNKQRNKLIKSYDKQRNKKNDIRNKIKSYLKNNYSHIAIQDENISSWHSGWFGKSIQESTIGGIIAGIKDIPHTSIVDRFYPSTKECPNCSKRNKIGLKDRIYYCSCGYSRDRDIHSANNILFESLKIVPMERRDLIKKPVETISVKRMCGYFSTFLRKVVCETGSPRF